MAGCKEVKWNMGEKKSFYSWNMTFIWTEFFSERFFPSGGAQPPFGLQDRKESRTPSPCGWWPCSPASACPTWRLFCTARSSYEERDFKKWGHSNANIMKCACLVFVGGMKVLGRSSPLFSRENGRRFFFTIHLSWSTSYVEAFQG